LTISLEDYETKDKKCDL